MDSWDVEEFQIHPNDNLEFQNTQNQLYGLLSSETASIADESYHPLTAQNDTAQTTGFNFAYPEGTTIIFMEQSVLNDVKPFECSLGTDIIAPVIHCEKSLAPDIGLPKSLEEETQPQMESASNEMAGNAAGISMRFYANQASESDSISSHEGQLQIACSSEISAQCVSKKAKRLPKSGSSSESDSPRKRAKRKFVPVEAKDDEYWARRAKNNEAARKSRASAKEKKRKLQLESMMTRNTDLKSRYISLCLERERLKCDAILLGIDLAKL